MMCVNFYSMVSKLKFDINFESFEDFLTWLRVNSERSFYLTYVEEKICLGVVPLIDENNNEEESTEDLEKTMMKWQKQ